MRIRFRLTNAGQRAGTEVAQAYVTLPRSPGEPAKRLLGWSRVSLGGGRSRTVQITLSRADLADLHLLQYWNERANACVTPHGIYTVSIGQSSRTTLTDHFAVRRR